MKHRTLIGRAGVRCADGRRARLDYYLLRSGGRFGLEALRLGRTLHRGTVTPCAVRDVLEELLSR